ncbi:MAG: hypothetical protein MUO82_04175 [Candidatus Thermoplasmatota archaeon]|nr:hypothetical protein [Candidatus Thermoplasmatota archaeon]
MNKVSLGIILVVLCIISANIVIAPSDNADNNGLTLTYKGNHINYTLEDLLTFDSITGNGGRLKSTGDVIPPYEYTGILITTFAQ